MDKTNRGFAVLNFKDQHGTECSLQQSSAAEQNCVWLGANEIGLKRIAPQSGGWKDVPLEQDFPLGVSHVANNRMHLSQDQVASLLPHLNRFVATGELFEPAVATNDPLGTFRIRVFKERFSYDANDYLVTGVATIEEAALKLASLQAEVEASNAKACIPTSTGIFNLECDGSVMESVGETSPHYIYALEPGYSKPVMGYVQIDATGEQVRHLSPQISVADGERLGDALNIDWPDYDDMP